MKKQPLFDRRFVCIAIIAFSPQPFPCQTNHFLPFCGQISTGRCTLCKHSESKNPQCFADLCFRRITDRLHAGSGESAERSLHSGSLEFWTGMVSPGVTPLPLCVNGTVHLKTVLVISVFCVRSTVSCREHISQGQCWLFNTRTHTHTHTLSCSVTELSDIQTQTLHALCDPSRYTFSSPDVST